MDVIGPLWNGLEDSLKKRGMLWTPEAEGEPYIMEGHMSYFKEGDMVSALPSIRGDTVLKVRVELSQAANTSDHRVKA